MKELKQEKAGWPWLTESAVFSGNGVYSTQLKSGLLFSGWILLLLLAVGWRLRNFDAFGLTNDEGAYLMWARLVADGYPLYSQTHTGAPPLFIELLALAFNWFGFSVVLGRGLVLACAVILAAALSYLGYRLAGWPGSYLALAVSMVIPPLFALSRQVMLEIPALLLAVLSVLCAYQFYRQIPLYRWSSAIWLIPAGILLAASLLVKYLHPLAVLPIGYFIWVGAHSWRSRLRLALYFTLSMVLTLGTVLAFYDFTAFFDQSIRFRLSTRAERLDLLAGNGPRLLAYAGQLWSLTLLTLAGLLVAVRRERARAWGLWFLGSLALLLWYHPLFPHHFSLILPAALLLSIEALAVLRAGPAWRWGGPLILLLLLLNAPPLLRANQAQLAVTTGGREADAARILNQVTRPDDFVMTDSQLLALWADRRTPPPLVDFSLVYIQSGRQTPERLIAMSQAYPVTAVAPWALRMVWLPEYVAWAADNFWVQKVYDNDHILYFGPKHPPGLPIPHEQQTRFQNGVVLAGYRVDRSTPAAGSPLPLTLYWQTARPLQTDYTIFVQLLDAAPALVAQNDSQPLSGYFPTSQWPAGELIPDRVSISLPAELPPGTYTLIAGLYDHRTLERVRLLDETQDHVVLTTITLD